MITPKTTLIIGGCRSGKSSHALSLGEKFIDQRNLFVATGQPHDDEMKARIKRHQKERGSRWKTVEEPLGIVNTIKQLGPESDIILIDCLTLWTSNLIMAHGTDDDILIEIKRLKDTIASPPCSIILVANEVGTGIVPENTLARRFRDLNGWCNQTIAEACNQVIWMVAGIPATIKPSSSIPC